MKSKLPAKLFFCVSLFYAGFSFAQVPTASFAISASTLCARSSVQLTDQSANQPTAWSYSVNGVATSTNPNPEITFPAAGTYSIDLEATNSTGSSAVYSETVLVHPLPTLTVTGSTLVCTGATSSLSGSGADTYSWSTGTTGSLITIAPMANMVYTLVGTSNVTGCSDSSFVSVVTIPLPTISVSDATICPGSVYTLSPSGASSYTFSGGSGTISPAVSTVYTVSGTDATTGCSDSTLVSITVSPFSISASGGTVCSGQNFTLVPSGGSSYTYSGGSDVVAPLTTTTYTIIGADASATCHDTIFVTVNTLASPTISINSASVCAGASFIMVPTGAINYTFSGGSATVAPLTTTTYVISGEHPQTGCKGSATFTLVVNPLPVITANSGTICSGDEFIITPSGAASYTFSSGSPTVIPASNTSYTITGTSAEGCVSSVPAIVNVVVSGTRPVISINTTSANVICMGETRILTASGATSYTWSTGETGSSISISPTITALYNVIGLDALSGCSGATSVLQYVSECTGLEQYAAAPRVKLYPNPATSDITIDTDREIGLTLVNTLGKVLLSRQVDSGETPVDLSDLPAGVYFVTFSQAAEIKSIKIIKH